MAATNLRRRAAFTRANLQLNKQMHQHTQLLFQTYSMCASDARRVSVTVDFVLLTAPSAADAVSGRVLAKHKSRWKTLRVRE